jgi:hypothetical protein
MRKVFIFAACAIVGLVLALIAIPRTRWIPLTQWDVLAGRWRLSSSPLGDIDFYVEPSEELQLPSQNTDEARMLGLISPPRHLEPPYDPDAFNKRIQALYDIAERQNKPEHWAQMVRVASQAAIVHTEPHYKLKPGDQLRRKKARELLLSACLKGQKLDPENCFFQVIASAAYHSLGQEPEAKAALIAASRCRRYDAYISFEPKLRLALIEKELGYRGEVLRAWVLANIAFPHFNPIRSITKHYSASGDAELRAASARIAGQIMRDDESAIGIYVGRGIFANALDPAKSDTPPTQELLEAEAAELEQAVPGDQGITQTMESYNKLTPLISPEGFVNPDDAREVLNFRPVYAAWALAYLFCLPGILGFAWLRGRFEWIDNVAPHLVWLLAIPLEPSRLDPTRACLLFAWATLLALAALFSRVRKAALILGSLIAAGAFVVALGSPLLAVPAALFLVSAWTPPKPVVAVLATLGGTALVAAVWVNVAYRLSWSDGLVWSCFGILGVGMSAPKLDSKGWLSSAAITVACAGLVYAAMAFQCMAWNVRAGTAADALLSEADRMRRQSGAF